MTKKAATFYRDTTARFYDPESEQYLPAFPLVWTPSAEIERAWSKHYDVIVVEYADRHGFLTPFDIGIYNFLQTYARISKAIVIRDFSIKYKFSDKTLVSTLDKLQNLELIDRVCRVDHRGHPNDLILRPPRSKTELDKSYAERFRENLSVGKTQNLRKQLGKDFPGNDAYFSEKQITRSLGSKRRFAPEFHEFCIEKNYKFTKQNPKATVKQIKDAVLGQVFYFCEKREIEYTDAVVDSALAICRHYGRKPFSLH